MHIKRKIANFWRKISGNKTLYGEWLELCERYAEHTFGIKINQDRYGRESWVHTDYAFSLRKNQVRGNKKAKELIDIEIAVLALRWWKYNTYDLREYFINNCIGIGHPGRKYSEKVMVDMMTYGHRRWFQVEGDKYNYLQGKVMTNSDWKWWSPLPFKKHITLKPSIGGLST